ncbi:Glyceraldehyde-3-phosphate dehydrogenase [bioreactor metagenome]|uniref:Glyceraldehyde-3-phosphate dehydrogenase n=1 Tax=bioreactor metagenome TaxID=1076179 RepID=A0A644T5H8_9ZZZZ|nr:glyceraldehyde 3-phosphate dehydrogenase NAD-binding domain-containing protein [Candidatus Elulimicrobiales bacterium]
MRKIAINGFGRIGRAFLKLALMDEKALKEIDIVAINDLGDLDNMIYLLNYDTVYRQKSFRNIEAKIINEKEKYLVLVLPNGNKKEIRFLSEKDPNIFIQDKIWNSLGVEIVVECTGAFVSADKSHFHIESGAKRVILSAPAKDLKNSMRKSDTVLMGINEEKLKDSVITSNASCTTNAGSPAIAILDEAIGIEKAILNTVHSYTASQALIDGSSKKGYREGRAAAQNIIPSTTGAAIAFTKAYPKLEGLFDGLSIRVPTISGSIADITFISKRNTSTEEINRILTNASKEERWKNLLAVSDEDLVSSDILGLRYAGIVDLQMTKVVDGNLVKILIWYDNEVGYANTLIEHTVKVAKIL